jgi:phosphoenolpyruvate carboxykinase (diphosphate)
MEKGQKIPPLSVYNPIHYQELPELFMDYISSLTGKSPSTTGAGSEGALTKGPFNMLSPVTDLNNALLSYILADYHAFTSAAGHIGTESRFDHDISLLIPELWSRINVSDRDPKKLIAEGSLEKLEDFEFNGKTVLASRLGYRITENFTFSYLKSIFDEPQAVFTDKMLRPEKQDLAAFADGINNIVEAQQKVALQYFADDSAEAAIPPLKALLYIMAYGTFEGRTIDHPEIRQQFTRESVISSDWYNNRLLRKQNIDIVYFENSLSYLRQFISQEQNAEYTESLNLKERIGNVEKELEFVSSEAYIDFLTGTIGADPLFRERKK